MCSLIVILDSIDEVVTALHYYAKTYGGDKYKDVLMPILEQHFSKETIDLGFNNGQYQEVEKYFNQGMRGTRSSEIKTDMEEYIQNRPLVSVLTELAEMGKDYFNGNAEKFKVISDGRMFGSESIRE